MRKQTHRALSEAADRVESFRFNVAVAKTMELVNATRKAIDSGPGAADPAVREAVEAVAIMLSVVGAPYTAEDMWAMLGHEPSVARAGWPPVDPALLVRDEVTCVVQINGKVRARLSIPPDIDAADLEAAAMALDEVQGATSSGTVRKVIVRPPKIVNIVIA